MSRTCAAAPCAERRSRIASTSHRGVLQCAACRTEGENDIRLPMSAGTRAALRYLDSAPSSRVFSFRLAEPSLSELGQITESYLCTRLERGFSTLDFYKSLFL